MKNVKIITITLLIVLITLVSFFGVYMHTQNRMENKIKDYTFSKEISGGRVVELKVSTPKTEKDTDKEDKETENKVEEVKIENLNEENIDIVKTTIEKRLNNLGAQDYVISVNKENGNIIVELTEDNNTDTYIHYLTASRKTLITEKETENVLLTDNMVKGAKYTYSSDIQGIYKVRVELELDKEGQAKLGQIQNDYAVLSTEVEEIEKQIEKEKKEKEEAEKKKETETEKTSEEDKTTENTDRKKIAVLTIAGSEYDIDKIEDNKIIIKVGTDTSRSANINNNIAAAAEICLLIESGQVPIDYELLNNRYIYSDISLENKLYFVIAVLAIFALVLLVLIIKYRTKGLLITISFVGFTSIFLLVLRYANVLISIEGICAIIITLIINLVLNIKILTRIKIMHLVKEAIKGVYKETFLKIIPIMILAITFCFSGWVNLNSFGMIMFWGLLLIAIYNIVITKTLLELKENK